MTAPTSSILHFILSFYITVEYEETRLILCVCVCMCGCFVDMCLCDCVYILYTHIDEVEAKASVTFYRMGTDRLYVTLMQKCAVIVLHLRKVMCIVGDIQCVHNILHVEIVYLKQRYLHMHILLLVCLKFENRVKN